MDIKITGYTALVSVNDCNILAGKLPSKARSLVSKWLDWITRPFKSKYFDFLENSDYFNEGMIHIKEFYRHINFFEGAFVYFARSQYGLYRILQRLGARVEWKTEKYI